MSDLMPIIDVLDSDDALFGHIFKYLGGKYSFEELRVERHAGHLRISCDDRGVYANKSDDEISGLFRRIANPSVSRFGPLNLSEEHTRDIAGMTPRSTGYDAVDQATEAFHQTCRDVINRWDYPTPEVAFSEPDPPEQFRPVSRANPLTKYPVIDGKIVVASPTVTITYVPKPDPEPEPVEDTQPPAGCPPVQEGNPEREPEAKVADITPAVSATKPKQQRKRPATGPGRVTQEQVVEYLTAHPGSRAAEIVAALNGDRKDVDNRLQRLRTQGLVANEDRAWTLTTVDVDEDDSADPDDWDPEYIDTIINLIDLATPETPVTASTVHGSLVSKWRTRYQLTTTATVLVELADAGQIERKRRGFYYPKETV